MDKKQKISLGFCFFGILGTIVMITKFDLFGVFFYLLWTLISFLLFKLFRKKNNNSDVKIEAIKNELNVSANKSTGNRDYKGKRLKKFVSDYTIIDLETTGFSPKSDKIIEISAIKVRDNQIINTFSTLINPQTHISSKITKITGIDDNMVATAPLIENVIQDFLSFVGDDIIIGHNVNFDINFIYDICISILNKPFKNDFIDTLYIARKQLPELEHHRLSDLADYYNIVPENAHRALCDCETTYKIYSIFNK